MKFTTKLFLFWISVFLVFYLSVMVILLVTFHLEANIGQLMLIFSITGILPPAVITAFFSKKLDYMESEDINPPKFKGSRKLEVDFQPHTSRPFNELLEMVDRNWIVSFSDKANRVVKFRTDSRIMSWGIGGYVKLGDDNKLQIVVYPVFENSKREDVTMRNTLQLMESNLKRHIKTP